MIAGYRLIVGPLLPLAVLLLLTYISVLELSSDGPPPPPPPPPFAADVGTLGCMSEPIAGCMMPSRGLSIVSFTCRPDSLIRFTTSLWLMPVMSIELTAIMRSPIFSSPHRSAGLPGIRSPMDEPRHWPDDEMITKPKPSFSLRVTSTFSISSAFSSANGSDGVFARARVSTSGVLGRVGKISFVCVLYRSAVGVLLRNRLPGPSFFINPPPPPPPVPNLAISMLLRSLFVSLLLPGSDEEEEADVTGPEDGPTNNPPPPPPPPPTPPGPRCTFSVVSMLFGQSFSTCTTSLWLMSFTGIELMLSSTSPSCSGFLCCTNSLADEEAGACGSIRKPPFSRNFSSLSAMTAPPPFCPNPSTAIVVTTSVFGSFGSNGSG
uniref:Uncharacterized protein n=1 Tax=Anopheles farauti TaxID=69004 RepID=A0A182Q2Z9_9DIPT